MVLEAESEVLAGGFSVDWDGVEKRGGGVPGSRMENRVPTTVVEEELKESLLSDSVDLSDIDLLCDFRRFNTKDILLVKFRCRWRQGYSSHNLFGGRRDAVRWA